MSPNRIATICALVLASFAAPPSHAETSTVQAQAPSWRLAPSFFSETRIGGQANTRSNRPSGGAVEVSLGYQFGVGLTPVVDFATSVMFDDVGDGTLWYLRAGAGLRYTPPLERIRPWLQATYGFIAYSLRRESSADVAPGHGLSLTAGCDFGLMTYLWLGLAAGADVGFYDFGKDIPVRAMLTLGFHL